MPRIPKYTDKQKQTMLRHAEERKKLTDVVQKGLLHWAMEGVGSYRDTGDLVKEVQKKRNIGKITPKILKLKRTMPKSMEGQWHKKQEDWNNQYLKLLDEAGIDWQKELEVD